MSCTAIDVARAIVASCPHAGRNHAVETEDAEARAQNLVRDGEYGPYIADGDPYGWGGERAVATILCETKGTQEACEVPLRHYGNGLDVACRASDFLGNYYIECINAAVYCVYPV